MQRVTEEHKSRNAVEAGGRDLRGDAAAHRLAANHQFPMAVVVELSGTGGIDNRAIAAFQLVVPVGNAAALLGVHKVEGYGVESARRQAGGEAHHETAGLVGAGSVPKNQI